MVAREQILLSLEPPEVFLWWLFVSEHQIAKDIDGVILSDLLIPLVNQELVHLLNVIEWSIAMADNIAVTQVEVTCEEDHESSPHFLLRLVRISSAAAKYTVPPSYQVLRKRGW